MEKKKKKLLIYLTAFSILSSSITYKLIKDNKLIIEVDNYLEDFISDNYLICAHRGYQKECIENTKEAIEKGNNSSFIDYIEIDVRLTKDNKLVLSHNNNLLNINERNIYISSSNYNDLLEDTYIYQLNPLIKVSLSEEEKSFLQNRKLNLLNNTYQLSSLLDGLKDTDKKIFLDLKFQNNIDEFIEELIYELEGIDTSNIIFQSTNRNALIELRNKIKGEFAYIINSKSNLKYINDFNILSINKNVINYPLIDYLLEKGKIIAIWTINDTKDLESATNKAKNHYKELIYISDYPDLIATKLYQKEIE